MKTFLVCSVLAVFLTACSAKVDENGAEVKVNNDTKDAWDEAGDKLEEGAEKAKAKLEDAGEAIKEGVNETKERLDDNDAKVEVEVKKD